LIKDLKKRFNNIVDTLEIDDPIACICVLSNGRNYRGFELNLDHLKNEDIVDMILYIIKNTNIVLKDLNQVIRLRNEIDIMKDLVDMIENKDDLKNE